MFVRLLPLPQKQFCPLWNYIKKMRVILPPYNYINHLVFTIPEELNFITITSQKEMYSILFKSVSVVLSNVQNVLASSEETTGTYFKRYILFT